jgi:hypothetical protein
LDGGTHEGVWASAFCFRFNDLTGLTLAHRANNTISDEGFGDLSVIEIRGAGRRRKMNDFIQHNRQAIGSTYASPNKKGETVMPVMQMIQLYVGDLVRRTHPWDGSEHAGMAVGPLLMVKKIYPHDPFAICELSDGKTEFECNLEKFAISMDEQAA